MKVFLKKQQQQTLIVYTHTHTHKQVYMSIRQGKLSQHTQIIIEFLVFKAVKIL